MLGYARTTRQGPGHTVALAFVACVSIRGTGLAMTNMAVNHAWAVPVMYAIPICAIGGALILAQRNMRPHQARSFEVDLPDWLRALPARVRARRPGRAAAE
jgi:lipopolysaccharide export system permease protein